MSSEKKTYKVNIFNESYSLVSDEPQEHITKSAILVDSLMKNIAEKSGLTDCTRVAVLAALQIASRLVHSENEAKQTELIQKKLVALLDSSADILQPNL